MQKLPVQKSGVSVHVIKPKQLSELTNKNCKLILMSLFNAQFCYISVLKYTMNCSISAVFQSFKQTAFFGQKSKIKTFFAVKYWKSRKSSFNQYCRQLKMLQLTSSIQFNSKFLRFWRQKKTENGHRFGTRKIWYVRESKL